MCECWHPAHSFASDDLMANGTHCACPLIRAFCDMRILRFIRLVDSGTKLAFSFYSFLHNNSGSEPLQLMRMLKWKMNGKFGLEIGMLDWVGAVHKLRRSFFYKLKTRVLWTHTFVASFMGTIWNIKSHWPTKCARIPQTFRFCFIRSFSTNCAVAALLW